MSVKDLRDGVRVLIEGMGSAFCGKKFKRSLDHVIEMKADDKRRQEHVYSGFRFIAELAASTRKACTAGRRWVCVCVCGWVCFACRLCLLDGRGFWAGSRLGPVWYLR